MLILDFIHQGLQILGHTFRILGRSGSEGYLSSCGRHGPKASRHTLHNLHCFFCAGAGTDQAFACENDLPRRGAGTYAQISGDQIICIFSNR